MNCNGANMYALMGMVFHPNKTYEEVLVSKYLSTSGHANMYVQGKKAVFAILYGATFAEACNLVGAEV